MYAGSGPPFSAPFGRPHVAFNIYRLTNFYNKSSVVGKVIYGYGIYRLRLTISKSLINWIYEMEILSYYYMEITIYHLQMWGTLSG